MSLLMEALRKAEQVKQQGTGTDSPRESVPWEIVPDPSSGPQRSTEETESIVFDLEQAGQEPLEIVGKSEDTTTLPVAEVMSETFVSLHLEEDIKERTPEPGSSSLEPPPRKKSDSAVGTGLVGAHPSQEAVPFSTASAPALPSEALPAVVPGIPATEASVEASRQAARAVFVAKSTHLRRARNRRLLLGLAAGLALLGVGGFLYFPHQTLANFSLPGVSVKRGAPPDQPATASVPMKTGEVEPAGPTAPPLDDTGKGLAHSLDAARGEQKPAVDQIGPMAGVVTPPAADSSRIPATAPRASIVSPASSRPAPASPPDFPSRHDGAASPQAPELLPSLSEPQPSAAIKIVHRTAQPQTDPLMTAAYTAYQQGDFEQSRSKYQRILQADPEHRGAMLGLAALALRLQETDLARTLYLRLLERDPSDPYAKVGLMSVMPKNDPVRLESELKLLLEVHPHVAPLSFFLGNLYAAGQRWNEAQQAYFNALQAAGKSASRQEAISPDYPFNLAISLEHLHKPDLAARYYREALRLAIDHPSGFDREALRRKLDTLKGRETQ